MTNQATTRKGGRSKGTPNVPPLDKIRANKDKLEKILLDKALTGDVEAIRTCLELIDDKGQKRRPTPAPQVV